MKFQWQRIMAAIVAGLIFPVASPAADEMKDQAISRLAAGHDPEVPVAIGRVVVKQAGLKAIRAVLAERGKREGLDQGWNADAPEWRTAEQELLAVVDGIIFERLSRSGWLEDGWGRVAAAVLNAEEADEIASHFATEGGREQRIVVELLIVSETVMANYTFTGRLDYRVKGTEEEIAELQELWWAREPFRARDFSRYPGAIRFAGEDPGVKYTKALAIQGIEVITDRIDRTAVEAVQKVKTIDVGRFTEAYRRRTSRSG